MSSRFPFLWCAAGVLLLSGAPAVSLAQEGFRWRGTVDQTVRITIRGSNFSVSTLGGQQSQAGVGSGALPASSQHLSIRTSQGRGSVTLIQQPTAFNNYQSMIEIQDPAPGAAVYDVLVYVEGTGGTGTGGGASNAGWTTGSGGQPGTMRWWGSIDGKAQVHLRGNQYRVETISGQRNAQGSVSGSLTAGTGKRYDLKVLQGRGTVVMVSTSMSDGNNQEVVVEINDPSPGASNYQFDVVESGGVVPEPKPGEAWSSTSGGTTGSVSWSGRIDGSADVHIRGSNFRVQTISGQSNANGSAAGRLPASTFTVALRAVNGRGTVRVVQSPSKANSYEAVVRIDDPAVGSAMYSFETYGGSWGEEGSPGSGEGSGEGWNQGRGEGWNQGRGEGWHEGWKDGGDWGGGWEGGNADIASNAVSNCQQAIRDRLVSQFGGSLTPQGPVERSMMGEKNGKVQGKAYYRDGSGKTGQIEYRCQVNTSTGQVLKSDYRVRNTSEKSKQKQNQKPENGQNQDQ